MVTSNNAKSLSEVQAFSSNINDLTKFIEEVPRNSQVICCLVADKVADKVVVARLFSWLAGSINIFYSLYFGLYDLRKYYKHKCLGLKLWDYFIIF